MRWVLKALLLGALLPGCGVGRGGKDAPEGAKTAKRNAAELEARLARSTDLTYTATYEAKRPDGTTQEVVVAQEPPRASYRQGDVQLLDDGQTVVSCTRTEGKDQCAELGPHTDAGVYGAAAGADAGFGFAFNPAAFIGLYTTAAGIPGVEAGTSTRDVAGQPSACVSVRFTQGKDAGHAYEGCTSDDGILTFSDDGEGSVVTLTSLARSASDSAFVPPVKVGSQQDVVNDSTSTTAPRSTRASRPPTPSSSSASSARSSTSTTKKRTTTTT